MPNILSIKGTITLIFVAVNTPEITPKIVPTTPIIVPWKINIRIICPVLAPIVRKIAISAFLSLTTITKVETILKENAVDRYLYENVNVISQNSLNKVKVKPSLIQSKEIY